VFNLSGSELVALLLLALIVLGPDKLPDAVRRFGKTYGELKKVSTGFQTELRKALDEPSRELRETADAIRRSVDLQQFDTSATPTGPTPTAPETPAAPAEPPRPALQPLDDTPRAADE
jgi:sec-independent protein translocase protein TatB